VTQAIVGKLLSVHRAVEHFITDNGREFDNNMAAAVHHLIYNVHTRTTAYNPQSNGKVENQNRTLKDMLSMYVADNQRDWNTFLPVIVHAYRTTVNSATGFSPFKALFGREARQPTEEWIEEFATSNKVDINEYVTGLTQALLYSWKSIGERILLHQQRVDYRIADKREKVFQPYLVDDLFYLKSIPKRYFSEKGRVKEKITAKLQFRYTGPHRVLEVKNPILYIALVNGRRKTVHAIKMKRDTSTAEKFYGYEDDIYDTSDHDDHNLDKWDKEDNNELSGDELMETIEIGTEDPLADDHVDDEDVDNDSDSSIISDDSNIDPTAAFPRHFG
jgi:transposase InsO family protein